MRQSHGFTLIRQTSLSEVSGTVGLWRHDATGAEVLSVCNGDENKCFGVAFRTPPQDSTGVAHILEHSVLCGSEKYPVKEPFAELLKGSLQTFLNAFTFPDKTCYPVASANLQDFYNLADVYLDAVFFPRISEDTFRQEGWHFEPASGADGASELICKGVVFNEMKGVYSSPDSVLMERSQQALFPDTTYGLDSGGDPDVIPNLTYEAFRNFHATHYHPSNARFFFWGDDPEEQRLALLEPYLNRFAKREPDSAVPLQSRLDAPRLLEFPFAAGAGEETGEEQADNGADKGHITVNWLLCETADCEETLLLEMLEHILMGLPGSPLRKALIESGLGEDLAGGGLETDLRQAVFSTGLRSVAPASVQEVEVLIMDTLADLAENGVPARAVEAAVNSVEFDLRENNSGRFPRGLAAMLRSLTTWLYDGDPVAPLAWEAPLARLKERLARGERLFESAISRWFLDNPHRATVVLTPDAGFAARKEAEEKARLARVRDSLDPAEQQELADTAEALRAAQAAPDSPEALASIPCLSVSDLPRTNARIPERLIEPSEAGFATLTHDLDTSGIVYADLLLPLDDVPARLLPLVPLFGRCLTEMGTTRHDFVELGTLLASKTGGIDAAPLVLTRIGDRKPVTALRIGGKATADKADDLFALLGEVLLDLRLDDCSRFTQMALEERARLEQSIIPAGHGLVATRLRAGLSGAGSINERMGGVSCLESLRALSARLATDWPSVLADLECLRGLVIRRAGALLNLTADAAGLDRALSAAARLAEALPARAVAPATGGDPAEGAAGAAVPFAPGTGEALLVPAQVNYVGKGCNLFDLGYVWNGAAHVIARHLRMAWLWDQVRVRGGAYGAFCTLDRASGAFTQVSYRDPNVDATLAAFDGSAGYLRDLRLSRRDLELAIIGAIGDLDAYLLPDARGMASLARRLAGDTEEMRQTMREQMLAVTQKDFNEFADVMAEAARAGTVCVLGGAAAENAAAERGWTATRLL